MESTSGKIQQGQRGQKSESKSEHVFKILLVGDPSTGKSCFLLRFIEGTFNEFYIPTKAVDFRFKVVKFGGETINLHLWDTAQQERYSDTSYNAAYSGSDAILILFDVTDRQTFDHVDFWIEEVARRARENVVIVLVGNKADEHERAVTKEEGETLANKHDIGYIDSSLKDNINVSEPFVYVTKKLLQAKGSNVAWWKSSKFE